MKIDKELDQQIAEKVFGWKRIQFEKPFRGIEWMWDKKEGALYTEAQSVPNYSSDLKIAWEVVEKLREWGYTIDVSSYPNDTKWPVSPYVGAAAKEWVLKISKQNYQCRLSKYDSGLCCWLAAGSEMGNSPSEAICLMALSALEQSL